MNRATSLAILISLAGAWESHAQNTVPPVDDSTNLPALNSVSSSIETPSGDQAPTPIGSGSSTSGTAYPPLLTQQYY